MDLGSTILDLRAFPDKADDRHVSHFVTHGLYQRTTTTTSNSRTATCDGVLEEVVACPSCQEQICQRFRTTDHEASLSGFDHDNSGAPMSARAAALQTARAVKKNGSQHVGRTAERTRSSVQNAPAASTTRSFRRTSSLYRTSEENISNNTSAQSQYPRVRTLVGRGNSHCNLGSLRKSRWSQIAMRLKIRRVATEQHLAHPQMPKCNCV